MTRSFLLTVHFVHSIGSLFLDRVIELLLFKVVPIAMGSGGDLGRAGSVRKCKRVNVHFKIPYTTVWGQSLVIIGSDALLGAWAVKEGVKMTPLQEGDILFWQIVLSVPEHFDTEYSYCVVDENLDTVRRESGSVRTLTIPEGLPQGANVEAHDFWQVHDILFYPHSK